MPMCKVLFFSHTSAVRTGAPSRLKATRFYLKMFSEIYIEIFLPKVNFEIEWPIVIHTCNGRQMWGITAHVHNFGIKCRGMFCITAGRFNRVNVSRHHWLDLVGVRSDLQAVMSRKISDTAAKKLTHSKRIALNLMYSKLNCVVSKDSDFKSCLYFCWCKLRVLIASTVLLCCHCFVI